MTIYIYAQTEEHAKKLSEILRLENYEGGDTTRIALKHNVEILWADHDVGIMRNGNRAFPFVIECWKYLHGQQYSPPSYYR